MSPKPFIDPVDPPEAGGQPVSPTINRPTGPAAKDSSWPSWATPLIVIGVAFIGVVIWIVIK